MAIKISRWEHLLQGALRLQGVRGVYSSHLGTFGLPCGENIISAEPQDARGRYDNASEFYLENVAFHGLLGEKRPPSDRA